jgi:hypothetical protein
MAKRPRRLGTVQPVGKRRPQPRVTAQFPRGWKFQMLASPPAYVDEALLLATLQPAQTPFYDQGVT